MIAKLTVCACQEWLALNAKNTYIDLKHGFAKDAGWWFQFPEPRSFPGLVVTAKN